MLDNLNVAQPVRVDWRPGAALLLRRDPAADARHLPAQPGRQVPDLRLRRARPGDVLGLRRHPQPGAGRVLRPRRLLHGDVPEARGVRAVASTKIQSTPGIPDFMDWNQLTELPLFWVPFHSLPFTICRGHRGAGALRLHHRRRDVQAPGGRRLLRHHHAGDRRDPHDPDHRPAGLHRRRQRHHRPRDAARLGHPHRPRQVHPLLRLRRLPVRPCMFVRAVRAAASSAACWWRCATRRTACASPATTSPTSRSSCSACAAVFAAIGGAMFTLQVGFMSPSFVGIVPSIEMVIFAAVGGRLSICRRGLRHAAGQLRQDLLLRSFPAALAVR